MNIKTLSPIIPPPPPRIIKLELTETEFADLQTALNTFAKTSGIASYLGADESKDTMTFDIHAVVAPILKYKIGDR